MPTFFVSALGVHAPWLRLCIQILIHSYIQHVMAVKADDGGALDREGR